MKLNYAILLIGLLFVMSPSVFSQKNKFEEIKIKTSSQCGMCKERIEEALAFEAGIKSSDLDLETQIITVIYKPQKTNPDKIKKAISKIGYDADDVLADEKAYSKLPDCCKKPGDPDRTEHK